VPPEVALRCFDRISPRSCFGQAIYLQPHPSNPVGRADKKPLSPHPQRTRGGGDGAGRGGLQGAGGSKSKADRALTSTWISTSTADRDAGWISSWALAAGARPAPRLQIAMQRQRPSALPSREARTRGLLTDKTSPWALGLLGLATGESGASRAQKIRWATGHRGRGFLSGGIHQAHRHHPWLSEGALHCPDRPSCALCGCIDAPGSWQPADKRQASAQCSMRYGPAEVDAPPHVRCM
jgi:hypothetical protein